MLPERWVIQGGESSEIRDVTVYLNQKYKTKMTGHGEWNCYGKHNNTPAIFPFRDLTQHYTLLTPKQVLEMIEQQETKWIPVKDEWIEVLERDKWIKVQFVKMTWVHSDLMYECKSFLKTHTSNCFWYEARKLEEWIPKRGDIVANKEVPKIPRIYAGVIEGAKYPYCLVSIGDEERFKQGLGFHFTSYSDIIPYKAPIVEITLEEIAKLKGVDVSQIRIKE